MAKPACSRREDDRAGYVDVTRPRRGAPARRARQLDEPTDDLGALSAEVLEEAPAGFQGTVLAVTHDRWFARSFDRFLVLGADGRVVGSAEPVFDEPRVARAR